MIETCFYFRLMKILNLNKMRIAILNKVNEVFLDSNLELGK